MHMIILGWTSVFLSGFSLNYSRIILGRTGWGVSGTHVGDDVIKIAYVTPVLACVLALLVLWKGSKGNIPRTIRCMILVGSTFALLVWLDLHLSGAVYSYTSAFAHKYE